MAHVRQVPPRPPGRPPTSKAARFPNNLRPLRMRAGLTQEQVAAKVGMDANTYGARERGDRRVKLEEILRFARAVEAEPDEVLGALVEDRLIEISAYVGPGGEVFPIEEDGPRRVETPRGLEAGTAVAAEVRGDSLFPIGNGWILFYAKPPGGVPFDAVGELCVVKLAGGPVLVRHLRRGYSRGRFNLLAIAGPPAEDVELEWAAPVRGIVDPQLVAAKARGYSAA